MEESSMKNNMSTPQEGSMPTDDELKKLRKREQRILERLQEARKAQANALERFQRAETRLQKRSDRLQRIEGRLTLLRQQRKQMSGQGEAHSDEGQPLPRMQPDTDPSRVGAGLVPALEVDGVDAVDNPASREDAEQPVNEARAAAEATEENVRLAAERASVLAESLQQAESPVIPQEIASIEEEEELTAAVTAETIAHITAERAAKAEVIAEISSKQTHEARRYVEDAEQALAEVRAAISSGVLSGEEAQEALWRAEHAVTRAQAFLADAEANEEQAVKAAMNAEADAEVAEGMAFAAVDHVTLLVTAEEPQDNGVTPVSSTPAQEQAPENNDDGDITTKISVIHPQEQP
jgi:chromosome segregation ATPase